MHQQIRSAPVMSPADLKAFLAVIERAGINIEAAGGSDVERGGEFAFAVAHEKQRAAVEALKAAGYHPRVVDVDVCHLTDNPGQLAACIARISDQNRRTGKVIRDLAIGGPDKAGRIPVQVYSEPE
jgi:hypothetical protein